MKPAAFEYHSPTTADEAVSLMAEYGEAELLAGNQSLGVQMSNRLAEPDHVIDLSDVQGLDYIEKKDGAIEIGAMTRHATVVDSELLNDELPLIPDSIREVAGPSVRNMGTIGGSLGEADPAGNYPTIMTALGATLTLQSVEGTREEDVGDFYLAYMLTSLDENEMITAVSVPTEPFPIGRTGMAFDEIKRVSHTWPKLSAAGIVRLDDPTSNEPVIEEARLAFGNAADTPLHAEEAEQAVEGTALSDDALEEAAAAAMDASQPAGEMQADADYKEDQVGVFTKRVLRAAYDDAVERHEEADER